MIIDATFWVAISFFIFIGGLIYLKIPHKINNSLTNQINEMKKEIEEAKKLKQMKEQQVQASSALVDPRTLAGPMGAAAAPIVVNAPATTNVNAPNTTNMSSSSTPMINTDRVFDKLSVVG